VVVALENPGHGGEATNSHAAAGAAWVATFGSPWLKLNYDVANVLTYSERALRPEDDLAAAGDALAHLHVKDARATPKGWAYVPLGDGDVALEPAEIRRAVRISLDRLNTWRRAAEATRAGEEPPIPGSR
jgi:sugar phosphate isomerase/epimerase